MKNKSSKTHRKTRRGFTLIEVMVVIAVISLLSSIIIVITNSAKAKGNDAATISQVHEVQSAFQIAQVSQPLPMPAGDAGKYYCLGSGTSAGNACTFWGLPLGGDDNVKTTLVNGGFANVPRSAPVVIDGLSYNGYVYKWNPNTNGPAIYWAQSNNTPCLVGTQVLSGVGGYVCEQDAGGTSVANSETSLVSGAFNFSLTQPGNLDMSGQTSTSLVVARTQGTPTPVTFSVQSINWPGCPNGPYTGSVILAVAGPPPQPPCSPTGGSITLSSSQGGTSCDMNPSCNISITASGYWPGYQGAKYNYVVVLQATSGSNTKTSSFTVMGN